MGVNPGLIDAEAMVLLVIWNAKWFRVATLLGSGGQ